MKENVIVLKYVERKSLSLTRCVREFYFNYLYHHLITSENKMNLKNLSSRRKQPTFRDVTTGDVAEINYATEINYAIRWIEIYSMDSAIQRLNNQGQIYNQSI